MKKLPAIFLAVSMITFVIGSVIWFAPINVSPGWTVIMPISPVTFGLFLITLMLEKEMTQFNEESAQQRGPVHQCKPGHKKCQNCKGSNLQKL